MSLLSFQLPDKIVMEKADDFHGIFTFSPLQPGYGLTIGNAVRRNKIKRKLKSAVQKILHERRAIDLNYTYVIFGKNNVYKDKFALVFEEMNGVFKKIRQTEN